MEYFLFNYKTEEIDILWVLDCLDRNIYAVTDEDVPKIIINDAINRFKYFFINSNLFIWKKSKGIIKRDYTFKMKLITPCNVAKSHYGLRHLMVRI